MPSTGVPYSYDRIPAECIISLSLARLLLRQSHVRALTFFSALLTVATSAALIYGRFTLLIASVSAVPAGILSILVPAKRLAERFQPTLDALRQVPIRHELSIDDRWIPAERI